MDLRVSDNSGSVLLISTTKNYVHFCVLTEKDEQLDFLIDDVEWKLFKSYIEQNMNLSKDE